MNLPPLPDSMRPKISLEAFELREILAEALPKGALYQRIPVVEAALLLMDEDGRAALDLSSKFVSLPEQIKRDCETCQLETTWQNHSGRQVSIKVSAPTNAAYLCKNCDERWVFFALILTHDGDKRYLMKVGQVPELAVRIDPSLSLGVRDQKLYRRALLTRNAGYGLACLAYLRRVVENTINTLIDLTAQAFRGQGGQVTDEELATAKRKPLEVRSDFARAFLPERIKRLEHNPFELLCGFASKGMHEGTEEECIELFDEVRGVFEGFFTDLQFELKQDLDFAKMIGKLSQRRGNIR